MASYPNDPPTADPPTERRRPTRAMEFARLQYRRLRAEVELLGCLTYSPRRSVAAARSAGFGGDDLVDLDTYAIWLAIEQAAVPEGRPWDAVRLAAECRRLLAAVDAWDDSDVRDFVTMEFRWGSGPLVALLTRVGYDPELIRAKVAQLRRVDQEQRASGDDLRGAA